MARFDLSPVRDFLRSASPRAWVDQAIGDLDTLLLDHATLELKAAQQAQKLIWKYGAASGQAAQESPSGRRRQRPSGKPRSQQLTAEFCGQLVYRMSRLAREELRHFEQVVARLQARDGRFAVQSPSRYAGALHALARADEPGALLDTLIIGAIIEARSCERFACLVEPLAEHDPDLAEFYLSLLRSEARHFEVYLKLAEMLEQPDLAARVDCFLERDAELIESPDTELRFHSGPVESPTRSRRHWRDGDRAATRRSRV